jgi:hypothetical protein
MPRYLLCHQHTPEECGAAVVSWRGFDSPLRGSVATASCQYGGAGSRHLVCWDTEAADRETALALLPQYVAQRTEVVRVADLTIP